ncbi:MAG: SGNH/GDSL hydrolase family protein [Ruminococcus sp.]|nr:SGNH/GDSL hydrolase family protein [Ruminococcus sp.]
MDNAAYIKWAEASVYNRGNNYRLKKTLEKNEVKLAFVGGSVTKGWDGSGYLEKNYTDHIIEYMKNTYPEKKIESANLSTESANSFIGLSITDKVINDIMPDIVFLEYAVNNECGHDHIISYESLVKRMLSLPSEPCVVLVFLMNKSFYTSQGYMKRIGTHYELASISVADTLKNMLDEGFDWSVYADDVIHPNMWGQRFIADCVICWLKNSACAAADTGYSAADRLYSLDYMNYRSISAVSSDVYYVGFERIECNEYGMFFNSGIRFIMGSKESFVKFEGEFKNLFAAFIHDKTDRFSDAEILIDGEKKAILQGKSIYGWGNVTLRHVFSFEKKGYHCVELRVKDVKKEFTLIEFGIS